jgi:hypothetical protein
MSKLHPQLDNEWCNFRPNSSKTLLITFSPLKVERGKFFPFRSVNHLDYDILRFNCPDSQWYVGGIPTTDRIGRSFEELLCDFIEQRSYEHVALFGGSKGGFAALDFGLRIPADTILATGAETLFGTKRGFCHKYLDKDGILRGQQRISEWPSLAAKSNARIMMLYGGHGKIDLIFAAWAWKLLQREPIVLDCDHRVPVYLEKNVSIATVIKSVIETGGNNFISDNRIAFDFDANLNLAERQRAILEIPPIEKCG